MNNCIKKVFIDGKAGTTGLRIYERLSNRSDIQILSLAEEERKKINFRKEMLNKADIVFLCLPDVAAIEAVEMIENPNTVVIDTSTAHRTKSGWVYGFPELSDEYKEKIKNSKRIAVPGCHASGFIALIKPLIDAGIVDKSICLSCHSITGYSGGGKKMIAQYEETDDNPLLKAPRQYGLGQIHKHLPEMKIVSGLVNEPVFCPIVSDYYSGMVMTIPLHRENLINNSSKATIIELYKNKYNNDIVKYSEYPDDDGLLSATGLSGKDAMEISVFGNEERMILTARYDNLGKGASGAAIEIMNIVMEMNITKGLDI